MVKQLSDLRRPIPKMRVFFVGSYLPRSCGIATFTFDLAHATGDEMGDSFPRVVALNNRPEGYDYPEEVAFEVNQNNINDYRLAAEYINFSSLGIRREQPQTLD